jgi:hypothetical protein
VTILSEFIHLDFVQEDKEILDGLHLGGCVHYGFSGHLERINKGLTYRILFFVYGLEEFGI